MRSLISILLGVVSYEVEMRVCTGGEIGLWDHSYMHIGFQLNVYVPASFLLRFISINPYRSTPLESLATAGTAAI